MNVTRTIRYDREYDTAVSQAGSATAVTTLRWTGPRRPNLVGWRVDAVSHDRAVRSGSAAISTCYFRATPQEQSELMGGARYHSFGRLDSQQQTRIPFGVILNPGEDLVLEWTNGTADKTVVPCVEATLLFDDGPPAKK